MTDCRSREDVTAGPREVPARRPRGRAGTVAALSASVLGFFVVTLDAVIVNIALPTIGVELHSSVHGLQWVVDAYILPFAATLLAAGWLTDRLGARRTFGIGLGVFGLSSLACAVSPSLMALVGFRVVQGVGGALLTPASLALLRQAFPDARGRARAVSVWALGAAIASASGALLGGLLTLESWRLIFLVNLPLAALSGGLLFRTPRSTKRVTPLDVPGQMLAAVGIVAATFVLIEGRVRGPADPVLLGAVLVFVLGSWGFWRTQRRSSSPMVPGRLLTNRTVRGVILIGFAFWFAMTGIQFIGTLYLQNGRGITSLQAGLAFLPMWLIGVIVVPLVPLLTDRSHARVVIAAGLAVMTGGMLGGSFVAGHHMPVVWFVLMLIPVGVGSACVGTSITTALLSAAPVDLMGTAGGVLNASRQLGGALAVAILGGLTSEAGSAAEGTSASLLVIAAALLAAGALGWTWLGAGAHTDD